MGKEGVKDAALESAQGARGQQVGGGAGFVGKHLQPQGPEITGVETCQHDRRAGATGMAQRTEEGHRRAGLGGKWGLRDQVEREEWEMWEHTQAGPDPGTQRVWPRAGCQ